MRWTDRVRLCIQRRFRCRTQFALVFPGSVVLAGPLVPREEDAWSTFAIVNTGNVPFDPSTLQVSAQIGKNDLPGPAILGADYEGPSFTLNPGEVAGDTLGLSLAQVQAEIPQAKSFNNTFFGLTVRFTNNSLLGGVSFVNTTSDLNFTVTLANVSASFTTVFITGPNNLDEITPNFVYSTVSHLC